MARISAQRTMLSSVLRDNNSFCRQTNFKCLQFVINLLSSGKYHICFEERDAKSSQFLWLTMDY